jgi:hypothetical protein
MERKIIIISDDGLMTVPDNPERVRMTICEIAALLGIFAPTAKRHIRAIEKSGIADGDYSMTCLCDGHGIHPEYYGLEMIAAVAFRISTWQANIFRRWLIGRATQPSQSAISVLIPCGATGIFSGRGCANETN